MNATDVINLLKKLDVLTHTEIQKLYKPTHGPCCVCQACGWDHDDCVCDDNEIIKAIREMDYIELEKHSCRKCGHLWTPEIETRPEFCPWCKSKDWNGKVDEPKKPDVFLKRCICGL